MPPPHFPTPFKTKNKIKILPFPSIVGQSINKDYQTTLNPPYNVLANKRGMNLRIKPF
jgi:hypothetical protein